jgi:hypothetical protein
MFFHTHWPNIKHLTNGYENQASPLCHTMLGRCIKVLVIMQSSFFFFWNGKFYSSSRGERNTTLVELKHIKNKIPQRVQLQPLKIMRPRYTTKAHQGSANKRIPLPHNRKLCNLVNRDKMNKTLLSYKLQCLMCKFNSTELFL